MVVIRKKQMQAFEKTGLKRFQGWLIEHLKEHFPTPCELVGDEQLRKLTDLAMSQSKELVLTTRHEICLYTDLMMMLGCGFATDPQYPWAADLLDKDRQPNATLRIDRTYDRAMAYLNVAVGSKGVFPVGVLKGMKAYSLEDLQGRFTGNIVRDAMRLFEEIWPAKQAHVGEASLGRLVAQGYKTARGYGLGNDPDAGVFSVFMYLLGHQFDTDPMFPWASASLSDGSVSSPAERLKLLHAEALKALDTAVTA